MRALRGEIYLFSPLITAYLTLQNVYYCYIKRYYVKKLARGLRGGGVNDICPLCAVGGGQKKIDPDLV